VSNASGLPVPRLTPGPPRRMLGEAIRHIRSLPRDPVRRADAFEALAKQIEASSGGAWNATRGTGADGSVIFLGRQGEGLVVGPDGRVWRGALGKGLDITAAGISPDYATLVGLDP
jgi:hypothetical protein